MGPRQLWPAAAAFQLAGKQTNDQTGGRHYYIKHPLLQWWLKKQKALLC